MGILDLPCLKLDAAQINFDIIKSVSLAISLKKTRVDRQYAKLTFVGVEIQKGRFCDGTRM